jgi:hypothetical protein
MAFFLGWKEAMSEQGHRQINRSLVPGRKGPAADFALNRMEKPLADLPDLTKVIGRRMAQAFPASAAPTPTTAR